MQNLNLLNGKKAPVHADGDAPRGCIRVHYFSGTEQASFIKYKCKVLHLYLYLYANRNTNAQRGCSSQSAV